MKSFRQFLFYYLPPLLWLGLIFYFSSIPDLKSELPNIWDLILRKIAHVGEYGILAVLILRMFLQTKKQQKESLPDQKLFFREVVITTIVLSILYAFSDEFHQAFVPGRSGSLSDVGFDATGVVLGTLFYLRIKV